MVSESSAWGYLPLNNNPATSRQRPQKSLLHFLRNGPSFALLAAALVAGLLGGLILSTSSRKKDFCPLPFDTFPEGLSNHSYPNTSPPPISPPPPLGDDEPELESLRAMVSSTRGYYARDYSMMLGWNNMRYIIETAVYHGMLLNRTTIVPSFVYARACEYSNDICAAYATMVNRGDAIGSDEWRELPEEQQMGWKVPISEMFNLTHLRRTRPVITVAEYLRLHGLSEDLELSMGRWDTEEYHRSPTIFEPHGKPPSLHIIENHWYDPQGLIRVDKITDEMKERGNWNPLLGDRGQDQHGGWSTPSRSKAYHVLESALSGRLSVLEWEQARQILQSSGIVGIDTDEGLTEVLFDHGWEVLYTFDGALRMDFVKNVVNPIKQVAPRNSIRGFVNDFYNITEDVLLLRGEIHYQRKPGSLWSMTSASRALFARMVLYEIVHTDRVKMLAEVMDYRMREIVGGKMWMAAHMRRGDFVRYHWAMQEDFGSHLARILGHLDRGRDLLKTLTPESVGTYAVPEAKVNPSFVQYPPPEPGDRYYVATDERDPGNLAYLREHGALRAPDLLTIEDRRQFGWPLMITDVLGIVEQELISRASFLYAHALSSVAGGALNLRAANGADPRTAEID